MGLIFFELLQAIEKKKTLSIIFLLRNVLPLSMKKYAYNNYFKKYAYNSYFNSYFEEALKIIKSHNVRKVYGHDHILIRFLKTCDVEVLKQLRPC